MRSQEDYKGKTGCAAVWSASELCVGRESAVATRELNTACTKLRGEQNLESEQ